jgi:two-component system KDP operon response regulator KdpE
MHENLDNPSANILIVDDETQITRVLRTTLASQGYFVRTASDGVEGLETIFDWSPDIVITDLAMPNMGGLEFCRKLRKRLPTAYIIVLSVRDDERQKVEAFDQGIDDYVTKPFSMSELNARIRRGVRRVLPPKTSNAAHTETEIVSGDFRINLHTRQVTVRERAIKQLTPKEYDMLCFLARNPNIVISRDSLLSAVWGDRAVKHGTYLHVLMHHLRAKIEPVNESVRYILTIKWVGYRFVPAGIIASPREAPHDE